MIKDAVELPYLYGDLFKEHELQPPKGILLYGPPGCGKTLIAKAVANSLAKRVAEKTGNPSARSYFLNIKGPELLNKYVGETERQIRLIFQRAREKSEEGYPVIVFFDEMDSLFRTRGTGISSDIESTIVPQLLAEIDGVESLKNVIVIGASNREDLIDPAILRPGRLDVKIKIERPDAESATQDLPAVPHAEPADRRLRAEDARAATRPRPSTRMIDAAVDHMYDTGDDNKFLEVTYQNGDKELLYFKDFSSGAMIENIVRRAKKLSIKRTIAGGERGIVVDDLLDSIKQEFREHEDLPNTTNPDDWAKISGQEGRAHRLRAHDRQRGRGARRPSDRARHDRPVPVARSSARLVDARPVGEAPPVDCPRGRPEDRRHRDRVRRRAPRRARPEPGHRVEPPDQRLRRAAPRRLGLRRRVARAATRAASPATARSRPRSRRTSSTRCSPTAPATTSTTRTPSTPRRSAATRCRPCCSTRRGSASSPARWTRPASCCRPARRSSSTRTTATARATRTAATRTSSSTARCRSRRSCATSSRGSSPARCSPARARSAPRTAPTPSTSRSASAPTSSRRRSGSRPR